MEIEEEFSGEGVSMNNNAAITGNPNHINVNEDSAPTHVGKLLSDGECSEDNEIMIRNPQNSYNCKFCNERYQAKNDIDDRIRQEIIGEMVAKTMKQLMMDGRLVMENETAQKQQHRFDKTPERAYSLKRKGSNLSPYGKNKTHLSISDLTIYDRAVMVGTNIAQDNLELPLTLENVNSQCFSSSSEEADLSDETILLQPMGDVMSLNRSNYEFVDPDG